MDMETQNLMLFFNIGKFEVDINNDELLRIINIKYEMKIQFFEPNSYGFWVEKLHTLRSKIYVTIRVHSINSKLFSQPSWVLIYFEILYLSIP